MEPMDTPRPLDTNDDKRDRYDRMIRVSLILMAVLLLACVACLAGFSALKGRGEGHNHRDTDTAESSAPVDAAPLLESVVLPLTDDAGKAYQDSLTFVGDSLTAHLINRGVLTYGQATRQVWRTMSNSGALNLNSEITSAKIIVPDTGDQLTIAQAAAQEKPPILIITLGTDWGVAYLKEEDFKCCYSRLVVDIQAASPETVIILQSIFPVTTDCSILNNTQINTANQWVKAVAAATGCAYLDTQSILKDDTGCLKNEYCISSDGIHLTTSAYEAILTYIRTHAYTYKE